jgi:hypothetical protein
VPSAKPRYFVGPQLLAGIRDVIAKSDTLPPKRCCVTDKYKPPYDQQDGPGFRVGTTTGTWSKGQSATVTWIPGGGVTATMVATNLFADISGTTATYNCAVARAGYTWFLIAAECQ